MLQLLRATLRGHTIYLKRVIRIFPILETTICFQCTSQILQNWWVIHIYFGVDSHPMYSIFLSIHRWFFTPFPPRYAIIPPGLAGNLGKSWFGIFAAKIIGNVENDLKRMETRVGTRSCLKVCEVLFKGWSMLTYLWIPNDLLIPANAAESGDLDKKRSGYHVFHIQVLKTSSDWGVV